MGIGLDIHNVAGIREGSATLHRGVNAVRGPNWQGKTSFVRALETAVGIDATLTEGESEGRVELTVDGETSVVTLHRDDGVVVRGGSPYLDDEYDRVCVDLYAFLDDTNELRRAVRRGESLEELLTRPLAFEDIEDRIADLKAEQREVESDLERACEASDELPDVQETVTHLESELEDLRTERTALLEDVGRESGGGVDENIRERLSEARAERARLDDRIDRLERAVERAEAELEALREERDAIDVPDLEPGEDIEAVRSELEAVERDISLVQDLYSANRRIVDEGRLDLVTDVERDLLADTVDCWVCGAATEIESVTTRVDRLGNRLEDLTEQAQSYRERVDRLESKQATVEAARSERRELDRQIADLEGTLADRRESLDRAREQVQAVEERVGTLAESAAESEAELTDLQSEIKYTEARLADERERLDRLSRRAERVDAHEATVEEIRAEIEQLRQRKSRVKQETREVFDETIQDLVGLFETSFESARLTGNFDLVVAREGREVSLDALSEGERELIGLVAALAGYEAYDVADRVPVLVLDGLSGLADGNLHTLVDYLDGRAEYLVVTAHPEHTSFDGHRIDPGEWTVVSDGPRPGGRS